MTGLRTQKGDETFLGVLAEDSIYYSRNITQASPIALGFRCSGQVQSTATLHSFLVPLYFAFGHT